MTPAVLVLSYYFETQPSVVVQNPGFWLPSDSWLHAIGPMVAPFWAFISSWNRQRS